MEPQNQVVGPAQSRGASGLTRYHRPLALRAEVSACPLLYFPSTSSAKLTLPTQSVSDRDTKLVWLGFSVGH